MPLTTAPIRFKWQTLLVLALTAGLLWLFFRNVDFGEIWLAITGAEPGFIVAGTIVTLSSYLLRAWRWQALLKPIGHARLRTAFRATTIGFTASFLLPGRVGEVLRPYLLAKQEGFKPSAAFATIVVERLLDLSTVLILFAVSLGFISVNVGADVKAAGLIAAVTSVAALAVLFVCAGHPDRLGGWAGMLARHLPAKVGSALVGIVQTFAEGLAVMRSPAALAQAAAESIPIWLSLALGIWFTSLAFHLTFSFMSTFLVIMFLVVGVAVPTPGGVGAFHAAYLYAVTTFFAVPPDTARAAALVLHAVSFVPVTLLGLFFMWQDGLTLGGLLGMRAVARAAETT